MPFRTDNDTVVIANRLRSDAVADRLYRQYQGITMVEARRIGAFAAWLIESDHRQDLTERMALRMASSVDEFGDDGQPQRFPYNRSSDNALRMAGELDMRDVSATAMYLRDVAESVRDHRQSYEAGHTDDCPNMLRRGFCHGDTQWQL